MLIINYQIFKFTKTFFFFFNEQFTKTWVNKEKVKSVDAPSICLKKSFDEKRKKLINILIDFCIFLKSNIKNFSKIVQQQMF